MAPYNKPVKTYDKKIRGRKSVDVLNALLAQNLTKRLIGKKKSKLKVKELPPRTGSYLTDDSLKVNTDDTFDKVLKGTVYNEVKVVKNHVKVNSSESDVSKSRIPQVSVSYHSPIMTRKRLRQRTAVVSEINSSSNEEESLSRKNSSTLDKPVNVSLQIEKENKKLDFSSLSYIKLPRIVENKVAASHSSHNGTRMEASYEPIFSDTFRERHTVHSSTPYVLAPAKKIVSDSISPIHMSVSSNSSRLIKKSYDEIKKWDSNFPVDGGNTPKGPVLRSFTAKNGAMRTRRRKLSSVSTPEQKKDLQDWKLCNSPKVFIRSSEMFDFKKTDQKLNSEPKVYVRCDAVSDFKGFTEVELSESGEKISNLQELLKSISVQSGGESFNKEKSVKIEANSRKSHITRIDNGGVRTTRRTSKRLTSGKISETRRTKSKKKNNEKKRDSFSMLKANRRTLRLRSDKRKSTKNKVEKIKSPRKATEKTMNITADTDITKEESQVKIETRRSPRKSQNNNKRYITLRRNIIYCEDGKKDKRLWMVRKKKNEKSPRSINITDDILSELEVSCSQSLSELETSPTTTSFSASSTTPNASFKRGVVSYSSEDLNRDLEINLPNLSGSFSSESQSASTSIEKKITERGESSNLSVDQKQFDRFMDNYFESKKENDKVETSSSNEASRQSSIISISDSDNNSTAQIDSTALTCADFTNTERKLSTLSEESDLDNLSKHLQTSPVANRSPKTATSPSNSVSKSNYLLKSPAKRSFNFTSENSGLKSSPRKSRIIVLSNISLGVSPHSVTRNQTLKTYLNIWHDHSYSLSPTPKHLPCNPGTPTVTKNNEESSANSLQLSDIIESSVLTTKGSSPAEKRISNDKSVAVNMKRSKSIGSSLLPIEELNTPEKKSSLLDDQIAFRKRPKAITLKPGKSYRRSLSLLKRSSMVVNVLGSELCPTDCACVNCVLRGKLCRTSGRSSCVIVPAKIGESPTNKSILEHYARSYVQESKLIDTSLDDSIKNLSLNRRESLLHDDHDNNVSLVTAKDIVLRKCAQTEVLPFEKCYPRSALQHCQKIGEGVYGEVFLYRNQNGDGTTVMKVIPIEGDLIVNGEKQKKFEEIVTEIVISTELSNLRNNKINCTSGFSEVKAVRCIQGCYPDKLLDLWELYDENHGSENDSPQIFPPHQLYVVLELANGGQDLESYVFNSALQVFAMFKQTACALAVAESQLKFEHRDLHWGNILIRTVEKDKTLQYRLNGEEIEVNTHGVEVSIIDFTLSRIEFDGVVIFNDLSLDNDLFVAKGDYQFEIYRLMQKQNGNEWKHFEAYSNVLWLHYLLDKAVSSALRYKNTRSKIHREYLGKLKNFHENILSFHSAVDFVTNTFM